MITHADCGCGYNETGRCSICDSCSQKAWEKRAGLGTGHIRRTATQPPRDVRERERNARQAARIKADRDLVSK